MKTTARIHKQISRSSPIPLKEQIRQRIQTQIRQGKLRTGEQVPSINQLASSLGVARDTVRLSLDSLVKRGVLYAEHGKGYFVANRSSRTHTVGLLGKLDGVYMRPLYEGLMKELGGRCHIITLDTQGGPDVTRSLIEKVAYHHHVDRLLVIPIRGKEKETNRMLSPFRRYFGIAWIDRAPADTKDATFLCDYRACVRLALAYLHESKCRSLAYFSRNPEDRSVFSVMRKTFRKETQGPIFGGFDETHQFVRNSLSKRLRPGIAAETDHEALYLQTRMIHRGVSIPGQMTIISGDHSAITGLAMPAIPAVNPGFGESGRQAAKWVSREDSGHGVPHFVAEPVIIRPAR